MNNRGNRSLTLPTDPFTAAPTFSSLARTAAHSADSTAVPRSPSRSSDSENA